MSIPAIKIDTLAIAKELEEAGVPVKQAEAQTRVYAKVINMMVEDQLVTKPDLAAVEQQLSKKIDALENEIKMQTLKITVRLGGLMVAAVLVLAAVIKL